MMYNSLPSVRCPPPAFNGFAVALIFCLSVTIEDASFLFLVLEGFVVITC